MHIIEFSQFKLQIFKKRHRRNDNNNIILMIHIITIIGFQQYGLRTVFVVTCILPAKGRAVLTKQYMHFIS